VLRISILPPISPKWDISGPEYGIFGRKFSHRLKFRGEGVSAPPPTTTPLMLTANAAACVNDFSFLKEERTSLVVFRPNCWLALRHRATAKKTFYARVK